MLTKLATHKRQSHQHKVKRMQAGIATTSLVS